jgi:Family of unknown function (DUF6356)
VKWLFVEHPRSVGETYFEHLRHALAFGSTMVLGGAACMLHALVPAFFTDTGSRAVHRLHERMVLHRLRRSTKRDASGPRSLEARPEVHSLADL